MTYFTALAVAFYLPETATAVLMAASLAAAVVLLILPRTRRTIWIPAVAVTVLTACCVNLGFSYLTVYPIQEKYTGSDRQIEATLTDEVYKSYSKYYYRLETDSIDGESISTKLLLKTAQPIDIEPYDTISFTADVHVTDNDYYLSKGYYLTVNTYDDDFTVNPAQSYPLYYHAIRLRQALRSALDEYLPEDVAALCKAVFVGDKYALDTEIRADFRHAGASYFIVVSGLHFSIICLLLYRLLRKMRLHRAAVLVITLSVILVYMAVTGFQPSVVRSGVMMAMLMIGRCIRRVGYTYNSLGLAGIVAAVAFGPYGAGDIGMILSFAATFAIVTWSDPIHRRISFKNPDTLFKRAVNAVTAVLSMSLASFILVFPISVFVFRAFSTVTLLSSLLLYLPIELLLIASLLLCVFFWLGPLRYLSLLLSWVLYGVGRAVLWLVRGLSSLPFSYIEIGHGFFYFWMGVTVLLGLFVILCRNRYRFLPVAATLSAIILLSGMITTAVIDYDTVALTVYQCGGGLTVGYNHRGTLYMLAFDANSDEAYELLDELSHRHSGAELAVCSRKRDFVNYSRIIDKEFAISHYLLYDKTIKYDGSAELIESDGAEQYLLGEGALLTLAPKNQKILSYLTVDGTTILVIPSYYPYKAIPEQLRRADIIVMSVPRDGYENLSCATLIVSADAETAADITRLMSGRYQQILYTDHGDVTVTLR